MEKHMASHTRRIKRFVFLFCIFVLVCVMIFPFVWMVVLSFKTNTEIVNSPMNLPSDWNLTNYRRALSSLDLPVMYKNTLIVVVIAETITVVITFMSSYALARMVFRSNRIRGNLYLFFLLGLAVPVYALLFPLYRVNIAFNLLNKFPAVIFPYIASAISFNTLLFVGFFNGFPKEIEDAAIIDGCNLIQLCTRIVAPICKPVFVTVIVFNVLYIWNEFPFASTFLSKREMFTLSLSASLFKGQYSVDYSGIVAATIMIIIPQLIFYALLQKYIIQGMTEGAVKG